MLGILSDPNEFFRRRVSKPGILVPLLIVILTAVVAGVGAIPGAELTAQFVSDSAQAQGGEINESTAETVGAVSAFFGIAAAFGIVLIAWILYSVVFYLIARFAFDGTGSLKHTVSFTGWGFVPLLVEKIVGAVAAYYVFSGASLPESSQAAQDSFQELQNDPVFLVSGILGLALLLWSSAIWTAAMEQLHDLSRRDAMLTVGITVAIPFLSRVVGLL
ncbi:YIP1 family protein [Natrinema caseinilyticum]|uniref:YIP1 family protein n=1 Tax=Natrinema caseinilyticum TaxID=2961570 RepID=UPI0020C31FDE|nr:YIP1 family protein [Natrinema caseinilyticum]